MPIGRIIKRILGMKCYDLLYLCNFSRDHLGLAEIDRCKLQTICQSWTSVLNIWRHATSNPKGCLLVVSQILYFFS